jgi:hypothetical protein
MTSEESKPPVCSLTAFSLAPYPSSAVRPRSQLYFGLHHNSGRAGSDSSAVPDMGDVRCSVHIDQSHLSEKQAGLAHLCAIRCQSRDEAKIAANLKPINIRKI